MPKFLYKLKKALKLHFWDYKISRRPLLALALVCHRLNDSRSFFRRALVLPGPLILVLIVAVRQLLDARK